ncbi:22607_t:CDS:2, partial [Gigaspora rosea]
KNKSTRESEENETNVSPNKVIGDAGFVRSMSSDVESSPRNGAVGLDNMNVEKAKARNKMSGVRRDCCR